MILMSGQYDFSVTWQPFLLHPECPKEGIPHHHPPGGDPNDPGVELLKDIGCDLGIEFHFRCPVWPNTVMAHILVEYAKTVNDGALHGQVVDRLFQLYFTKGRALAKRHIIAVAEDFGFDLNVVEKLIEDPDRAEEIKQKAAVWRTMGIEAIPFIFMNGHSMFSGDQDEAALINTITKVAQKFPLGHGDTCL
ncbi:unnamed protein product [Candidula unifasciata]|uniref:DSBA-like thioredoxin domain-containing protein n=1 Tax=Candidula unifasciata TaxID=100452 RepID=A0A8S3ZWJ8_9EUPU|nr:unnamed protein product [Candidula unifasciata]